MPTPPNQVLTQGQQFTDPNGNTGTVNFDTQTGAHLAPGQTTNSNPGIVSSSNARTVLSQGSTALDEMTNTPDPYLEYLQGKANTLINTPSQPGVEEQSAKAAGTKAIQGATDTYDKYKAGLETLGIQSGLSRYAPNLQADRMVNAENTENSKISDLQDKQDLAIAKAKQARLDKDAVTLKSTLEEIRQIKKDKADAIQQSLNKRTQDITVAKAASNALFKELKNTPDDQKEALINQYATDNNISVFALHNALAEEQDTQARLAKSLRGGSGKANYTGTQLGKLRAAGIDPSDSEVADNYLFNKGVAPKSVNKSYLVGEYGTGKVWDLALALGIPRHKDLSKSDEIDALFADPKLTSYVQNAVAQGYDIDQIIAENKK